MGSHKVLKNYILKDENIKDKILIEIGTTREVTPGTDSTAFFHLLSLEKRFKFITVDMDAENTNNAKKRFHHLEAITMKGEDYLANFDRIVDYVYLDAFDFYHNNHSEKRKGKYRDILKCEISDLSCHKMHLECCMILKDKMESGGLILFDDIINDKFDGKGKTAIPYLLENGFKIIEFKEGGCLLEKE
jgi:hypothetical protein